MYFCISIYDIYIYDIYIYVCIYTQRDIVFYMIYYILHGNDLNNSYYHIYIYIKYFEYIHEHKPQALERGPPPKKKTTNPKSPQARDPPNPLKPKIPKPPKN